MILSNYFPAIFCIVVAFFISKSSYAQFDFNKLNNDSFLLKVMEMEEGVANHELEFTSEQILLLKNITAWITVDTLYLINKITSYDEKVNKKQDLEFVFLGFMYIIEAESSYFKFDERKVRNILLTKKLLDERFAGNDTYMRFSKKLDYYYFKTYFHLDEFNSLIEETLAEEIDDDLFETQLFSDRLFLLRVKGEDSLANEIILTKYREAPSMMHNFYLNHLYHTNNYDVFLNVYSDYPINPFVRIQLANIYFSKGDTANALQVVDDIITELQDNNDKGIYTLTFVDFPDESPTHYVLPSEYLMNYIDIYYQKGATEKACFLFQYLEQNYYRNEFRTRLPTVNYPYLIPEKYMHLYLKNIEDAEALNNRLFEYKAIYEMKCQ